MLMYIQGKKVKKDKQGICQKENPYTLQRNRMSYICIYVYITLQRPHTDSIENKIH